MQYIFNYIYCKYLNLFSLRCILMHFNLKKKIHSSMEEEIYAGEAGGSGCWKVRQWEGELIPKPENSGAGYFWNFLSPFPFIHQPWPRKYTSICDKNSLTKPVQTSNNSPNHFRLSPCSSTRDSGPPGLEPPGELDQHWPSPGSPSGSGQSPVSLTLVGGKLNVLAQGSC